MPTIAAYRNLHVIMKNPIPKFIFILLAFASLRTTALAQALAAYEDARGFFYVFDDGAIKLLEGQKVTSYSVGRNMVAYVNNLGQFKVYENGYAKVLRENAPSKYTVTDYLMVFELGGQLYVYEYSQSKRVTNFIERYVFGDSLIAFTDFNRNLNIWYKGGVKNLEVFDVQSGELLWRIKEGFEVQVVPDAPYLLAGDAGP